jgi:hypothetical protein
MMIDLRYHSERNVSLVLRRHAYLPVFISVLQVDPCYKLRIAAAYSDNVK